MPKPRKPRRHELMFMNVECIAPAGFNGERRIRVGDHPQELITAGEARRFAAWLLKAIDWMEGE